MAPQYTRLTSDVFIVQWYAKKGKGVHKEQWIDLRQETSSAAAYAALQSYQRSWGAGTRFRIVKRRIAKERESHEQ